MKYDYLIVGAGLFGAGFRPGGSAQRKKGAGSWTAGTISEATSYTKRDRRDPGAPVRAPTFSTLLIGKSGSTWNQFAEFNNYINSPIAIYKDELYNLPFNMNTFSKMWNIRTPQEAKDKIQEQIRELNITEPKNLEEQALSLAGRDVYEKLIKGYTEEAVGQRLPGNCLLLLSSVCPSVLPTTTIILTTVSRGSPWEATPGL